MEATFQEYVDCLNQRASDDVILRFLGSEDIAPRGLVRLPAGFEDLEISSNLQITILHHLADNSSAELAAILLVRLQPKADSPSPSTTANSLAEFRRHVFCLFKDTTIMSLNFIDDIDELRSHNTMTVRPPNWTASPAPTGFSLSETYRAYFHCVSTRTMGENLSKYTHDQIVFNGHPITREQYRGAMEECHDVMADCKNTLERLIVDEARQRLAARVVFEWTPIKRWAGIEPTGRRIRFTEHVFVWFDGGRMHTSITLLDMEAFRKQMGA